MAAFGDIYLSDAIPELLSRGIKNIFEREGIGNKFKKLSSTLRVIEGVLVDAEEKQITSVTVKNWLSDLRDCWYDLDDILDEINGRALIKHFDESIRPKKPSSYVSRFLPSCSRNTPASEDDEVIIDRKMMQRIDDITRELDHISEQRKQFNLREMIELPGKLKYEYIKPSPLLEKHHVYGRDEEKEAIIRLLLENDDILVIPIFGMGGIGKTTLAKLVYHDERVGKYFDVKAWTCVSDEYNEVAIIKKIYEDVTGTASDCRDLDTLHVNLKGVLADKKFLIVLDDLWNDCYRAWLKLKSPLLGKPGSRILVTTRLESVVDILGSPLVTQVVRSLRNEECLSIMCHHAQVSFIENPELEDIGIKLVQKCRGLPLAAEVLGGVLRSKKKRKDWEKVLSSNIWNQRLEKEILPVLWLSYNHLPLHLKNLFAYCAIFPKDYKFDKNKLVHLWVAEGLIKEGDDAGKTKEEIGLECFDDLYSRSFFQLHWSSNVIVMHDLMNDLAQQVAGGICHHFKAIKHNDLPHRVSQKIRHSSYRHYFFVSFDKFQNLPQSKGLRSFFHIDYLTTLISGEILFDVIPKLCSLRVLSLSRHAYIEKLPDSLFELIHLRYLDLSATSIVELPDSVGNLVLLEFLLLRYCKKLKKLPKTLGSLSKLRHLDNSECYNLQYVPAEIGTLKSLQALPCVVLNRVGGLRLKHLEDFMLLEGTLSISQLQNATDVEDGKGKYLESKHRLKNLELQWIKSKVELNEFPTEYFEDPLGNRIPPEDVLEMLQPHENLRVLRIKSYYGSSFPNWIGDEIFTNLLVVVLVDCAECSSLPPLGQLPNLECLNLVCLLKVERIDEGFYGNSTTPFPKLQKLELRNFPNLREWIGFAEVDGISHLKFNCLRYLEITHCLELETAPQLICPSLSGLTIECCSEVLVRKNSNLNSLEGLFLRKISKLTHLKYELMQSLSALKRLEFYDCEELELIWPELPCNLELLRLYNCQSLLLLPKDLSNLGSCKEIHIIDCPKIDISHGNKFPPNSETLRYLAIRNSPQLGIDPERMSSCMSLEYLTLEGCANSSQLFEQGLRTNLQILKLINCADLESLPRQIATINSLRDLEISGCYRLVSFPSFDLPPSLRVLRIRNCKVLRPLKEWGLHNLSRLRHFAIIGGYEELEQLSDTKLLFPPSLEALGIAGFPKLISLAHVLENLYSLRHLGIWDCEMIDTLPSERVLKNLLQLTIHNCPLLEEKCVKDKGEYWPKIAHIRLLKID